MKFTKRMAPSINQRDFVKFTDFFGTHIGEVVDKKYLYDGKEIGLTILVLHSTCKPREILNVDKGEYDFVLQYPEVMQGQLYYKNFRRGTQILTNW